MYILHVRKMNKDIPRQQIVSFHNWTHKSVKGRLYELSPLRESGRFLTDKALWGVATDRSMKTTHNAFIMLLMCFTSIFQTQIR